MARTDFAQTATTSEEGYIKEQAPKPTPLGAFVHVVTDNGDDVWFYANLPEHVISQFATTGAAHVEIVPIIPKK